MSLNWQCSSEGLERLDKQLFADIESLLNSSSYMWYVTSGWRSLEEQSRLFAQGRTTPGPIVTKARAGQSAHNYGRAVDLALDGSPKPGLQMAWNWNQVGWLWLRAQVLAHPRLHSGWTWGDWPHVEVYKWRERPMPIPHMGA